MSGNHCRVKFLTLAYSWPVKMMRGKAENAKFRVRKTRKEQKAQYFPENWATTN